MSWKEHRTPISCVIGKMSSNKKAQPAGYPNLTTLHTHLQDFQINIVQDLTDSSVNSVTISAAQKEAIEKVKNLLEQHNVKIFSCGTYWICAEYRAYLILRENN